MCHTDHRTSTLLWCEVRKHNSPRKNSRCLSDRSAWTKYIAEPVNTVRISSLTQLTNLLFFAAAIYGMYHIHQQRLPPRFYGMYIGMSLCLRQVLARSDSARSSST